MDIVFFILIFGWIPIQRSHCDENIENVLAKKTRSFDGKISESEHNSFYEFLQESDIVVDRSLLIKSLVMDMYGILYNKTAVITAPGNFGKTKNLQMLEFFFSVELDENGFILDQKKTKAYKYFVEGKLVAKNGRVDDFDNVPSISKHSEFVETNLAQYPVIYLHLNDLKTVNKMGDFLTEFKHAVSRACRTHNAAMINFCEKNLDCHGKNFSKVVCLSTDYEVFTKARDKGESEPFRLIYSLQFLCEYLQKYYGKTVAVLIDDYDALFRKLYAHDKFAVKKTQRNFVEFFFLEFIDSVFTDKHLYFGVLTGVYPFLLKTASAGKYDIQYFRYTTVDFFHYYTFSTKEVEKLFQLVEISPNMAQEARILYYGYNMEDDATVQAYNPWSIVKLVNFKKINFYWVRDGPYTELVKNFTLSMKIKDTTTQLLAGKQIEYTAIPPLDMYYFSELDLLIREGESSKNFPNFTIGIQYWFLWLTNADGYLTVEGRDGSFYTKIPTTENREGLIAITLGRKLKFREEVLLNNSVTV